MGLSAKHRLRNHDLTRLLRRARRAPGAGRRRPPWQATRPCQQLGRAVLRPRRRSASSLAGPPVPGRRTLVERNALAWPALLELDDFSCAPLRDVPGRHRLSGRTSGSATVWAPPTATFPCAGAARPILGPPGRTRRGRPRRRCCKTPPSRRAPRNAVIATPARPRRSRPDDPSLAAASRGPPASGGARLPRSRWRRQEMEAELRRRGADPLSRFHTDPVPGPPAARAIRAEAVSTWAKTSSSPITPPAAHSPAGGPQKLIAPRARAHAVQSWQRPPKANGAHRGRQPRRSLEPRRPDAVAARVEQRRAPGRPRRTRWRGGEPPALGTPERSAHPAPPPPRPSGPRRRRCIARQRSPPRSAPGAVP